MKSVFTIGVLGLLLGISACTTSDIRTEPVDVTVGEDRLTSSLIGTWRGVIPCADCPGINYNLSLKNDNTFEETMIYQERDVTPYTRSGTWQIRNGILQLSGAAADTSQTQFDMSVGGELHLLDREGKRITTNLADHYVLRRDLKFEEDSPGLWDEKRRLGIDFVATGNEPGWALEIDLEKGMYFRTLPTETIVLDTPVSDPEVRGRTTIYRGNSEGNELTVEFTEQDCKDTMSGKVSPYSVRVTAKGIQFNGCGIHLGQKNSER
ncbi:copper resistance protein NlpE N-terminal domain-containing protein [Pontibacter burrus]|uniref:Copper resistance protein NlpE n=1 Tax=Pontibacter burrus TaxID=2704466 RepID=A0A6B3LV07_9BACT|nr:copper resistance protein NlpE N-terminal domain-containing protein [Pontibacter burrus]NEM97324.1 hypothetical protein [Pontibacter burrus]